MANDVIQIQQIPLPVRAVKLYDFSWNWHR